MRGLVDRAIDDAILGASRCTAPFDATRWREDLDGVDRLGYIIQAAETLLDATDSRDRDEDLLAARQLLSEAAPLSEKAARLATIQLAAYDRAEAA